ncbi:MAG: hypothetical protein HY216_16590 [Candidatus Rokubacteria bacterium]|nr:hypothetical protein [Candidatus Rokubacteria bacterium]
MSYALRLAPDLAQTVRAVEWTPFGNAGAPSSYTRASALLSLGARPEAVNTSPAPQSAEELFAGLTGFIGGTRDRIGSGEPFPWADLDELVRAVLDELGGSDELFWVAHRPHVPAGIDYVAFHQARVTVMGLKVATTLGYEESRLYGLGRATALFDVGLWRLPAEVARQADLMSPETLERYRAHPGLSAEIVARWAPPDDTTVAAMRHHHEREQGQGYPAGLRGDAIPFDAKVIALLDTYAGLTAPPPPRAGRPPHDALREIIRSRQRAFPSAIIKALIAETSLFPPGTLVRVSSGEAGRVIGLNRNHPLRPRVELLARGHTAARVVDLTETPFLYITGPIS